MDVQNLHEVSYFASYHSSPGLGNLEFKVLWSNFHSLLNTLILIGDLIQD